MVTVATARSAVSDVALGVVSPPAELLLSPVLSAGAEPLSSKVKLMVRSQSAAIIPIPSRNTGPERPNNSGRKFLADIKQIPAAGVAAGMKLCYAEGLLTLVAFLAFSAEIAAASFCLRFSQKVRRLNLNHIHFGNKILFFHFFLVLKLINLCYLCITV